MPAPSPSCHLQGGKYGSFLLPPSLAPLFVPQQDPSGSEILQSLTGTQCTSSPWYMCWQIWVNRWASYESIITQILEEKWCLPALLPAFTPMCLENQFTQRSHMTCWFPCFFLSLCLTINCGISFFNPLLSLEDRSVSFHWIRLGAGVRNGACGIQHGGGHYSAGTGRHGGQFGGAPWLEFLTCAGRQRDIEKGEVTAEWGHSCIPSRRFGTVRSKKTTVPGAWGISTMMGSSSSPVTPRPMNEPCPSPWLRL